MRSQNVRGSVKANAQAWFQAFRRAHQSEQVQITCIQETHCSAADAADLERQHAALWGYRPDGGQPLSYWSTGERSAGVAILLHPDVAQDWTPALQMEWSPHCIALETTRDGRRTLLCNVYAPSMRGPREALYRALARVDTKHYDLVIVGGDFNCTQQPADRSAALGRHASVALEELLTKWCLLDVADAGCGDRTWTYHYATSSGERRASRLEAAWARCYDTEQAPLPTDHKSVLLGLADPARLRVRRPRTRVYPPPAYAAEAAARVVGECMDELPAAIATGVDGWDELKTKLRKNLATCSRQQRQKMKRSYRQRLQRITKAQHSLEVRRPDTLSDAERERLDQLRDGAARLHADWHLATRQQREAARLAEEWSSTRAAFARVSIKRGAQPIEDLRPTPGFPARDPQQLADTLADGWVDVLTSQWQDPTTADARIASLGGYVGGRTRQVSETERLLLDADISETEVLAAIHAMERHKSPGPDQIPNDFYLDHATDLAGPLAQLFQRCWDTGRYPAGHREATIFAVAKKGPSPDPLQYRPLAMLNADYKILARVVAFRLRRVIRSLVHVDQHAFVPGRTIHEAIDVLAACWASPPPGADPADPPVALMLDFAKAYDSIERDYLLQVLREMRLPARFLRFVDATHTDTTASFLVNGGFSRAIPVTRGIRQGCPLAPMLFILGLEPLIATIVSTGDLDGYHLQAAGESKDVQVVAYADDTTLYLVRSSLLPMVRRLLDDFAECSGLSINVEKSTVLPLLEHWTDVPDGAGFAVLQHGQTTRYLGVFVGQGIATDATWAAAFHALRVRMLLAERKLHSVLQRAALARAIIVPKLLYVARHAFPSVAQRRAAQLVILNYIWGSTCSEQRRRGRAWISECIARLSTRQGGMGVPDLRSELQLLCIRAWLRWNGLLLAAARLATTLLIMLALPGRLYASTSGPHCTLQATGSGDRPALGTTFWATGFRALCFAAGGADAWSFAEPVLPE